MYGVHQSNDTAKIELVVSICLIFIEYDLSHIAQEIRSKCALFSKTSHKLFTLNYFRRHNYDANNVIEKYLCQRLPYEDWTKSVHHIIDSGVN